MKIFPPFGRGVRSASSLFECKRRGCRVVWNANSSSGFNLHERLARQLEDVHLRADALERTRAAAQALLKSPYLAEALAVLAAAWAAARPVLRCDFARLRKEHVSMRAVMPFARRKEGALLHIGNRNRSRWCADARGVTLTPFMVRTIRYGGLS